MIDSRRAVRFDLEEPRKRLAVLIDADNAQASVIEQLLTEIATFGEATVKRIYGDFTSPQSASWKKVLQRFAIKPVQQFAYTTGKNATDSSLIIDAMDLLYTRNFDGFCLITSDSDFTGLAMRLREEGLTVLGFGERQTPDAFRNACHRFVFTEVLRASVEAIPDEAAPIKPVAAKTRPTKAVETLKVVEPAKPAIPSEFLLTALEQAVDESGWATLARLGSLLIQLKPDFDSRLYGFKKLSDLVKANPALFTLETRPVPGSQMWQCMCMRSSQRYR